MADAREYVASLRSLGDKLYAKCGHVDIEDVVLVKQAATLIERLTPKPMTLQEIAEIMNREQYRGATDWRVKASGGIGCIGEHLSSRTAVGLQGLPPFESTAVAEKLEREKEAARA